MMQQAPGTRGCLLLTRRWRLGLTGLGTMTGDFGRGGTTCFFGILPKRWRAERRGASSRGAGFPSLEDVEFFVGLAREFGADEFFSDLRREFEADEFFSAFGRGLEEDEFFSAFGFGVEESEFFSALAAANLFPSFLVSLPASPKMSSRADEEEEEEEEDVESLSDQSEESESDDDDEDEEDELVMARAARFRGFLADFLAGFFLDFCPKIRVKVKNSFGDSYVIKTDRFARSFWPKTWRFRRSQTGRRRLEGRVLLGSPPGRSRSSRPGWPKFEKLQRNLTR